MRFILFFFCILVLNCSKARQLDIQGHRGARGLMPENTIPAFKQAIDLGVTTLELDVVISKDQQVVVSHEPFMNHNIALDTFGNEISPDDEMRYNLYTMTYDSIRLYDCGSRVHPEFTAQEHQVLSKPLLIDVIEMAEKQSGRTILYNIEIKSKPKFDGIYTPEPEIFVELVLDVLISKGIQSRSTLQSFDTRSLELIYKMTRRSKIALLVDEDENISVKLSSLSFKPDIISPYFKLLDLQTVTDYHNKGYEIIPWTVNEISDMNLMMDFNVDGIISDYPNRVIQLVTLKQ